MSIQIEPEQATLEEAASILLERMAPSKVVRLLSAWQAGHGDYLAVQERLFAGETVESLFAEAQEAFAQ